VIYPIFWRQSSSGGFFLKIFIQQQEMGAAAFLPPIAGFETKEF
jgi:hypothetical protein